MTTKFDDIAPLYDHEVKATIEEILHDPGFEHAVRYIMPDINWEEFSTGMRGYGNKIDFQRDIISNTVWMLGRKSSSNIVSEGWEKIDRSMEHLYLSNHRDIILDAGFLNIMHIEKNLPTTEIAIGDNLLIHPWIEKLVRLNKSFIVRRGLSIKEQLISSKHLSEYIHYCIKEKGESVWMAQREGRAKDADDRTQIGLLKMLSLYPEKTLFVEALRELNIIPLSISYEYDPCDYLKAKEFQQKRDNPDFKKSQQDDLLNMEVGILQNKGNVLFRFGDCINNKLDAIPDGDKRVQVHQVAAIIDREIHLNYEIFPGNYIAHDLLHNEKRFADKYTAEDEKVFGDYLQGQIEKIDLIDKDYDYLTNTMLIMYSNVLKNHLIAQGL